MAAAYFSWAALILCQVIFSRMMCPLSVPFGAVDSLSCESYVLILTTQRDKKTSEQAQEHSPLAKREQNN